MKSYTLVLFALMGLGIFGCSETSGPAEAAIPYSGDPQVLDEGVPCGDALKVPFEFPNGTAVGTLFVYNDESYLTVEFGTDSGWLMAETQAVLLERSSRAPHSPRGRAARFHRVPLSGTHQPPITHYAYWVNLEEAGWSPGDTLYLSARMGVVKERPAGRPERPRAAWVGGPGFAGRIDGRLVPYVIQLCDEGGGEGGGEGGTE
jgi:hypothetical protein